MKKYVFQMCITVEVRSQQYKNNHSHRYYTFRRTKVLVQKHDEFCKGLIFLQMNPNAVCERGRGGNWKLVRMIDLVMIACCPHSTPLFLRCSLAAVQTW
jgi:hypothetical protein